MIENSLFRLRMLIQILFLLLTAFHRDQCWVHFYLLFIFYPMVTFFILLVLISIFTLTTHKCTYPQDLFTPLLTSLNVCRMLIYPLLVGSMSVLSKTQSFTLPIDNCPVKFSTQVKILAVILDGLLSFGSHSFLFGC